MILAAGLAIALGTYVGGWRIIRTLGKRVSEIQTTQGFTAESTSGAIILASTHVGLPLSTTQVCTGTIFGAGAGRRFASVHWVVACEDVRRAGTPVVARGGGSVWIAPLLSMSSRRRIQPAQMSVHHEKMDGVRTHGEHAEAHLDTTTCRRSAQTLRRRSRF